MNSQRWKNPNKSAAPPWERKKIWQILAEKGQKKKKASQYQTKVKRIGKKGKARQKIDNNNIKKAPETSALDETFRCRMTCDLPNSNSPTIKRQ